MALQFREMLEAPQEEGKDLMLWSFEQGGWNRGA
jgi:hypothetical protein